MSQKSSNIICGIYKITNPTGRVYIGQSVDIYKTFSCRYFNLNCRHQPVVLNSLKKHGVKAHKFEAIHLCSVEELNKLELYYSQLYNSTDRDCGMNVRECGGSRGRHSEETKKKMSVSIRKAFDENPELRKKISDRVRGRVTSEESKRKQSQAHIGKTQTAEAKAKVSKSLIGNKRNVGKKMSEDQKEYRRKLFTGRVNSPEAIEKTRQANIGKKHSEETKRKLSEHFKGKKIPREIVEKNCKIILNLETGIFYVGVKEVAEQMGTSELSASRRLNGYLINKTSFVYV